MIISHSKNVIFLETPKTGSMSFSSMIRFSEFYNPTSDILYGQHTLISQAIADKHITKEQANSYCIYAFVRNPWDRFVSAWNHDRRMPIVMSSATKDNLTELIFEGKIFHSWILNQPQTYMFENEYNIQPLLYEDYNNEVRRVFNTHGVADPAIANINIRRTSPDQLTTQMLVNEESRRYIEHRYAEDFALWNKTKKEHDALGTHTK